MHPSKQKKWSILAPAILVSGLIIGTLDLVCAMVQTLLAGRSITAMLQFIASGIFDRTIITGTFDLYAFAGVIFHYVIALIWTAVFFLIYPLIFIAIKRTLIIGILYGVFVWLMMNKVVLPLSHTPPLKPSLSGALIGISIIVVAVGLPLAYFARRFYQRV